MNQTALITQPESFRRRLVGNLEKVSARLELVDTYKVFVEKEFEYLWNVTGGHGGTISSVVANMPSLSLEASISEVRSFYGSILFGVLDRGPEGTIEFLCKMRTSHWRLEASKVPESCTDCPSYLLRNNVITVGGRRNRTFQPQHSLLQEELQSLLEDEHLCPAGAA